MVLLWRVEGTFNAVVDDCCRCGVCVVVAIDEVPGVPRDRVAWLLRYGLWRW